MDSLLRPQTDDEPVGTTIWNAAREALGRGEVHMLRYRDFASARTMWYFPDGIGEGVLEGRVDAHARLLPR
jgi:hypothetical protein